jgi:hypothetical protein
MSYLAEPTSKTDYGIVLVGENIDVDLTGVISLAQDVSPTSSVSFADVNATGTLTLDGDSVVISVIPSSGNGIDIVNLVDTGPDVSFTIANTGVLSLIAGQGITLSSTTGDITISSNAADFINTVVVTANYSASSTDEYIGVNSTSLVTITLPTGINGRVYTIKDEHGSGFGKINVIGTGGQLVDGVTPYVITVPRQSISAVFRGGSWRLI